MDDDWLIISQMGCFWRLLNVLGSHRSPFILYGHSWSCDRSTSHGCFVNEECPSNSTHRLSREALAISVVLIVMPGHVWLCCMNLFFLPFYFLIYLCVVFHPGSVGTGVRYKHHMMNQTWRQIPVAFSMAISMYTEGIYSMWWIAGPGCNHISSLNNKRPLCWRLSAYRMTWVVSWDVRSIWIKCALDYFSSFFSPPILSVQLLWKGVMHLESHSIPSMHVPSLVGSSATLTVSDVSSNDLQVHHCVCLLLSSSWAIAYLFCYIKHIAHEGCLLLQLLRLCVLYIFSILS